MRRQPTAFASQKNAEAHGLWQNYGYEVGVTKPLSVPGFVRSIPGSGAFGNCETAIDPQNPFNDKGEIMEPTPPV